MKTAFWGRQSLVMLHRVREIKLQGSFPICTSSTIDEYLSEVPSLPEAKKKKKPVAMVTP